MMWHSLFWGGKVGRSEICHDGYIVCRVLVYFFSCSWIYNWKRTIILFWGQCFFTFFARSSAVDNPLNNVARLSILKTLRVMKFQSNEELSRTFKISYRNLFFVRIGKVKRSNSCREGKRKSKILIHGKKFLFHIYGRISLSPSTQTKYPKNHVSCLETVQKVFKRRQKTNKKTFLFDDPRTVCVSNHFTRSGVAGFLVTRASRNPSWA